jgi:hypothetical protein
VGIGTSSPSFKLNVDPQGSGGILIGNPNAASGNFTSLTLGISAAQNGYPYLQGTKASGSDYGTLVLNPFGGTVAIGTNSSGGYKLSVKGAIHAQQVNIDMNGWADYVFKKDFYLRPLSEVKYYIDQYQHLPDVPAEKEMADKGIDVAIMMKVQMKKIEELTLYLIEKDKELKRLNDRISVLERKNNKSR